MKVRKFASLEVGKRGVKKCLSDFRTFRHPDFQAHRLNSLELFLHKVITAVHQIPMLIAVNWMPVMMRKQVFELFLGESCKK
jgi:hypothetical protein